MIYKMFIYINGDTFLWQFKNDDTYCQAEQEVQTGCVDHTCIDSCCCPVAIEIKPSVLMCFLDANSIGNRF